MSGGSDSVALLVLLVDWAARHAVALRAASVDHGLRADSADEVRTVAALCARLGVGHDVLRWRNWDGRGNLMDAARRARLELIAAWAASHDIGAVALGHTLDDQAETVLMRLARGSGVDGLAGMAAQRQAHGVAWLRPLLRVRRETLRAVLRERGIGWSDDPSNTAPRFARSRARSALAALASLGLSPERLAQTADALADARSALARAAHDAAARLIRMQAGDVLLHRQGLADLAAELRERIVAQILCEISGRPYRPRRQALRRALTQRRATLHGCVLTQEGSWLRIGREWNAVRRLSAAPGMLWDNRWEIVPPPSRTDAPPQVEIRALGPLGLQKCVSGARTCGLPRQTLMAGPAVWHGADLVAAPLVSDTAAWRARCRQGPAEILAALLSH